MVVGLVTNNLITPTIEKSIRVCIEESFVSKVLEVKSDYFKIDEFDSLAHKSKTKFVESIEQEIINYLINQNKCLINDSNKISSKKIMIGQAAKNKAIVIIETLGIK